MKILIVDDEPRHVRGMSNMISMMRPDAQILAAKDGIGALEIMRSDRPDVVLSDIQMPLMDGLAFLKQLEEEGIRTKVVMVSAYNLFEYAQTAIRHGAYDYLLKPVDSDKVEELLKRLELQLAAESKQQDESADMRQRLHMTTSAYRSRLLHLWLSGNLSDEERAELEALDIVKDANTVVLTELSFTQQVNKDRSICPPELVQQLEKVWSCFGQAHTFSLNTVLNNGVQLVTVVHPVSPIHEKRREIREALSSLREAWLSDGELIHGVGSNPDPLIHDIGVLYRAAQTAIAYTFHDCWSGTVFHDELLFPKRTVFRLDGERLFEALQEPGMDSVKAMCRSAFDELAAEGQTDPKLLKEYASLTLMKIKSRTRDVIDRHAGSVVTETAVMAIPNCAGYEQLIQLIAAGLGEVHQSLSDRKQDKSEMIMEKCLSWIQEHFMKDLTLEMAAEQFFFNASYFSTLIKSRTGKSFSDHITEARMRHAKELLAAGNLKIYEIAARCGYRDTKYFTRMFKKQTGLSPEAYKHISFSQTRNED
ncbi:response regulator [Paenibacillus solisilvae]|uniref:Response regulator n=1 Tax=Paenibacillus solisilvae TaxID=2486751 RepID=A0ABW0VZ71_9BACL